MQPQTQAEIQTQTDVAVLSPSSSSSALVATNSNVNNEKNDKNNNTSDSSSSTSPPAATDGSTSSHGPAAQTPPPQRKIKRVLIELRTLFATMQARYCRRTVLAKRMRKHISVPKPRYHVCISFFLIMSISPLFSQEGNVRACSTKPLTNSFGWDDSQAKDQNDIHELNRFVLYACGM